MLLLVAENVLRRRLAAAFFVVGRADEIAGVAFADQLRTKARRVERNIVQVRVNGGEHLASMRLPRLIPLDHDLAGIGARHCDPDP